MTAVVLWACATALAYGMSDFVGGLGSRHASYWTVGFVAQGASLLTSIVIALGMSGSPLGVDLLWGGLAGIGNAVGTLLLYRGLGAGAVAVVAPVSALAALVLPLLVAVGEHGTLPLLTLMGAATALIAIWLVTTGGGREPRGAERSTALAVGTLSGAGFALMFVALSHISPGAGGAPLVLNQAVAASVAFGGFVLTGAGWHRGAWCGIASGALGAAATVAFTVASRYGNLGPASAIAALYPCVTVTLAVLVLGDPLSRRQGAALVLSAAALWLVATGG
ncbi:EamA family transporter [Nocardioides sp.]|uniref:EamA family transporter n=1 Tax=Nocardioides sp. TaxID=35761 RepID=UPI00261F8F1F|nr:EamA family transporter [Nocardioides sp.]